MGKLARETGKSARMLSKSMLLQLMGVRLVFFKKIAASSAYMETLNLAVLPFSLLSRPLPVAS
jgi:hypothetical protein